MNNKLRPILIVGGLAVIGYALYRYYLKQIDFLKDVTYQITGVRIKSISASLVSLDISAKIFNASNVEAIVKQIYLDVFINNVKVGVVNEVKDIPILPQQSSDVTFNFSFNPRLVVSNIRDVLSFSIAAKDLNIDMNGYVKVKSAFISSTIPFEYKNNLKSLLNKK